MEESFELKLDDLHPHDVIGEEAPKYYYSNFKNLEKIE
jgi:hypothetical protein